MTQSAGMLQSFVGRIERLEEQKKALTADISEVYKEAKSFGLDIKILRKVIAKRKKSAADRQEEESMIDVYMVALGAPGDGIHTFTRADGVKVTLERAKNTPKEITPIQEVGPASMPLDGRGETSMASDAPADPIAAPDIPPDVAAKAADDDVPQQSASAADPFPEMPDFMKRQRPFTAGELLAAG